MNDSHPVSPLTTTPEVREFVGDEATRAEKTRALFDAAAPLYDQAEWLTGLGSGPWYRRRVLHESGLRPGMQVLDVAIGTGLLAREALKIIGPTGKLIGLDPSPGMLAEARRHLSIETIEARAESIPLPDGTMDFLSMGYALRHVSDLAQTFREFFRVLKPGGRVCLPEISRPKSALGRFFLRIHLCGLIPFYYRITGRGAVSKLWIYYWETIAACAPPETIMENMRAAGFTEVNCKVTLGIFREYTGVKPG